MRNVFLKHVLSFCLLLGAGLALQAQMVVRGTVTDEDGFPAGNAVVRVQGTSNEAMADEEGVFEISVNAADAVNGQVTLESEGIDGTQSTSTFAYAEGGSIVKDFSLGAIELENLVAIGYSTVKEEDATGSVELLTEEDFNKGAIVSSEQLLAGRASGVRIINDGGGIDSNATIRIRGGSSLSGNNDPLIVIDDVPLNNVATMGQANPLTFLNPNDIESFSILKDASATAIYGSRASNGVIIIKTKKGTKGAPKFNYSGNVQVGTLYKTLDVMSGDEYAQMMNQYYPGSTYLDYLGHDGTIYNTDWQDEIYQNSVTTDHNFSASANLFGKVPFRASVGYAYMEGLLLTDQMDRFTASIGATPKLLNDDLTIDFNVKGTYTDKSPADTGAIGNAISANPTKPVKDPNSTRFGGYYQALQYQDGNDPITNEVIPDIYGSPVAWNPVGQLLNGRERTEEAKRILGNIKFDYKLPFLRDLSAIVNLGLDYSESETYEETFAGTLNAYQWIGPTEYIENVGRSFSEEQAKRDQTMDLYLAYNKDLKGIITHVDAQGGYSYQDFVLDGTKHPTNTDNKIRENSPDIRYYDHLNLQSFFIRTNFSILDKYLFTLSTRADGSSLFREEIRWGFFPAAAVAWQAHKEDFLKDISWIKELKFRAGWGITGQQDVTYAAGYYPYTALYRAGHSVVQYQLGDEFYTTYRANMYNPDLTWEKTTTYNVGVDYNLFNNFIEGSFDYYYRNTSDLLVDVPFPEGSLEPRFVDNIGNTQSEGIEGAIRITPIDTKDFTWSVNANAAFNETYVTDLYNVSQVGTDGDIGRGTGVDILQYAVGQRGRVFSVYEQIYDENGRPIQDAFVDQNNDGVINDDDLTFVSLDPKWTYGFGTNLYYKNFDFSANFRGQIGGKVYNSNELKRGYLGSDATYPSNSTGFIMNVLDYYDAEAGVYNGFLTKPSDQQAFSDYYLEDASFLRFDNVTLGYKFNNLFQKNINLRIYGSVNNVFVVTDYDGLDPEQYDGIDNDTYTRPRVYTFGVSLDF